MEKQSSGKEASHCSSTDQPYFKAKPGSVFPKPRKLVKTMMMETIASSVFGSASSSEAGKVDNQNLPKYKPSGSKNKVSPKIPR